jgi:hypothetical protein
MKQMKTENETELPRLALLFVDPDARALRVCILCDCGNARIGEWRPFARTKCGWCGEWRKVVWHALGRS